METSISPRSYQYDLLVEYYSGGRAITRAGDPERAVSHFGFPAYKLHFLTKDYRYWDCLLYTSRCV